MLLLPALAFSPALLAPAPAGELDLTRVPADANWLVHVDLEAFRTTRLWQIFQEEMKEGGDIDVDWGELEEFERRFGFRPFHDVDSVTVSGASEIGEDPVILVETSANLDTALAQMQQESEYRSITRGGVQLHAWTEHGDIEGAFYVHQDGAKRVIVVSESDDLLMNAIDVLQGKARNLRQSPDPRLFPRPTPGAFLFVDATAVLSELSHFEPASAVADMARGARIEVGESRGEFFLSVEIDANNAENAQNIYSVINGAKALAAMAGAQEDVPPFAMDILNSVEVRANGEQVSLQFRYDASDLVEEIRELEEWDH